MVVFASLHSYAISSVIDTSMLQKRYNQVAFLTTHNAFNARTKGFKFPNQEYGLDKQLKDGVRAFMLDVYSFKDDLYTYHGNRLLGSEKFINELKIFHEFLTTHPKEVITIILECDVECPSIKSAMDSSGLSSMLFAKADSSQWPTLAEMIERNERLVLFSDVNDASANDKWYHYMWEHMVETDFSVNRPRDFHSRHNRGQDKNDLVIFNHFVTSKNLGIGRKKYASKANDFTFLINRLRDYHSHQGKFPNFITLDFYSIGDGIKVVNAINNGILENPIPSTLD